MRSVSDRPEYERPNVSGQWINRTGGNGHDEVTQLKPLDGQGSVSYPEDQRVQPPYISPRGTLARRLGCTVRAA